MLGGQGREQVRGLGSRKAEDWGLGQPWAGLEPSMGLAALADPRGWPAEEPGARRAPQRAAPAGGAFRLRPPPRCAQHSVIPSDSAFYFGVWGNSTPLGLGE